MPRNPSVISRPVRAPRRSSSALVATVVPCAQKPTSSTGTPSSASCWRPSSTARAGWRGVEGRFQVHSAPVVSSYRTKSQKVPPVSTASRYLPMPLPSCRAGGHAEALEEAVAGQLIQERGVYHVLRAHGLGAGVAGRYLAQHVADARRVGPPVGNEQAGEVAVGRLDRLGVLDLELLADDRARLVGRLEAPVATLEVRPEQALQLVAVVLERGLGDD